MIGFKPYQELRIFLPSGAIISKYAKDYNEVEVIKEKYKDSNIYIGTNPKKNEGRKAEDVSYRRTLLFDLEMEGDKLPLTNKEYKQKLNESVKIIDDYMQTKFKFKYSFVITSGRGLHIYYTLKPLDTESQREYNKFYTTIVTDINRRLPRGIKADKMIKDLSRILGLPGTQNKKYKEKSGFRKILKINNVVNDLKSILDKIVVRKKTNKVVEHKGKLNIESIQKKPEFKIFTYKNLPKGTVNNRLRLTLKLLMRDSNFSFEDTEFIAYKITEYGYPYKNMFIEGYDDFEYSESIINNWVIDNYEWCLQNNFKIPYKLKYKSNPNANIDKKIFIYKYKIIDNFKDVLYYIIEFNNKYVEKYDDFTLYYDEALKYNLKECCVKDLWSFIEVNNIFNKIRHIKSNKEWNNLNDISEWVVK